MSVHNTDSMLGGIRCDEVDDDFHSIIRELGFETLDDYIGFIRINHDNSTPTRINLLIKNIKESDIAMC